MIVTRQRPKPRQIHKILLPVIALLVLAAALVLPPSRNVIFNGPLAPLWRTAGGALTTITKPFHFAAMNNEITAREQTIAQLRSQIAADKVQISERDKTIGSLQSQVNQVMQQSAADKQKTGAKVSPATGDNGIVGAGAGASVGSDLAANASPDMRRTANYWASMDAESAAKVVQREPIAYTARIFALMPPDAVGQILNNLPAPYAATLTQEHPELRR